MKYFLIKTDPLFDTAPNIRDWFFQLDPRNIRRDRFHKIPERQLMYIHPNPSVVFTDVLSFPFFLVTETLRDVIKMYEPTTIFKEIVLLDNKNSKTMIYHLPALNQVDCLDSSSKLSIDNSTVLEAVIDLSKVGEHSIFQLAGVRNTYVVARLDIVESFLRRGACGIGLEEIKIIFSNEEV